MDVNLVLASSSPRRQELLQQIGVRFITCAVNVPEFHSVGELPATYAARLALSKARAGLLLEPARAVLGADTIVVHRGAVLEKPVDREDALAMLARLSDSSHSVITAVALCREDQVLQACCETTVNFRAISPAEAQQYWATGEPQDKAGGYGIQGYGAVFVRHIAGSYSNVVGLPLTETAGLLTQAGVPVWNRGYACER